MNTPDALEIHALNRDDAATSWEYLVVVDRANNLMLKFDGAHAARAIAESFISEGNEDPEELEVAERLSEMTCGIYLHQMQGGMEGVQPLDDALFTDTSLMCTVQLNQHTIH